jgi:hypothetical protein
VAAACQPVPPGAGGRTAPPEAARAAREDSGSAPAPRPPSGPAARPSGPPTGGRVAQCLLANGKHLTAPALALVPTLRAGLDARVTTLAAWERPDVGHPGGKATAGCTDPTSGSAPDPALLPG